MSSNLENDFKKVSYKRKRKIKHKFKNTIHEIHEIHSGSSTVDPSRSIKKISELKAELLTTDLFQSVSALLNEALRDLGEPKIIQIICVGLGHISELIVARYQLALLLCLKDMLEVELLVADPAFNSSDLDILKHFSINVQDNNVEGKYYVNNYNGTVLFYLPHCPKQLMNNLLWSNWGLSLNKCVIIGNSFNGIVDSTSKWELSKSAEYINKILPYVLELAFVNNFKFFEVFNDTSIHIFLMEKLNLLTEEFWIEHMEPEYSDSDIEFIRKTMDNKLFI
ncbi:SRR1-like protein [Euwallacea fornicatus]|uniref:SRR1-like protein n=1 Tax=Euwallacea fornicatus TaxID=995702 RepID=UPI00338ED615